MADETQDRTAADAEAAAEVKTVEDQNKDAEKVVSGRQKQRDADGKAAPVFANTVKVTEKDFPSVEDDKVNVLAEYKDANEGWTVQSENPFVDRESVPGTYVRKHELPTVEGLKAHDIDPVSYVAGVAVSK